MEGKIVPLRPRAGFSDVAGSEAWNSILGYVQPLYSESLDCLKRAAAKASPLIRQAATEMLNQGERICPALFLAIVKHHHEGNTRVVRYAASLEALDLALRIHRSIDRNASSNNANTTAILAGDFFFSQSLTLAADAPIFIKGMAEIIYRAVSSEIDGLSVNSDIGLWRKKYLRKLSDGYASMLALSATLAGWCCKMEPWQNEALAYYGHYVGMGLRLKQELKNFQQQGKDTVLKIRNLSLPIIYVLEHSPYQKDFLALLMENSLRLKDENLLREYQKIKPEVYIKQIAGNCISRARERLELLRGSLAHDAEAILNYFTIVHELV